MHCLTSSGSLTERLMNTGHAFSVMVLQQGLDQAQDDEAALLGLPASSPLYAREVALMLDGTSVVIARSIVRADCEKWMPILERGRRSLGLTLFAPRSSILRETLQYREISAGHPLYALAVRHDMSPATMYPARRSNFILDGATLNVCEIFLPALEAFL